MLVVCAKRVRLRNVSKQAVPRAPARGNGLAACKTLGIPRASLASQPASLAGFVQSLQVFVDL